MKYLGDFADDSTVRIFFTTNAAAGGAVAPSSALESADVTIYKDNSATQKATTNGLTMTSPFDSIVGLHLLEIDCSNDTGDAGFWATGSDYSVILNPDETVDSQTVVHPLGQFSIENRSDSAAVDRVILALPNAAADAAGGLAISDAGGLDLDAKLAATNEVTAARMGALTDWIDGGRLDLIIDAILVDTATLGAPAGVSHAADIAAIKVDTAAILVDTGTTLPATLATIAAYIDTEIAAILVDTGTTIPALIGTPVVDLATDIAGIQTDTTAIVADTNELQTDWIDGGRLDLIVDAILVDTAEIGAAGAGLTAIFTTQMTESYAADGVAPTPAQSLFLIQQSLTEVAISSTTETIKKLDGSTTAATLTLDDASSPTSKTRAT